MATTYTCGHCGEKIANEREGVHAGFGLIFRTKQLCKKYGDPIAKMLKKYKLEK